jgi:acyl-CoA dehydrogenase
MTEPEHPGSNPTQLSCAARRSGDSYVIDGHKWFTSSAEGAAFAIVMAITDPDAEPHRRASMLLVPTDTPGFRPRPQHLDLRPRRRRLRQPRRARATRPAACP